MLEFFDFRIFYFRDSQISGFSYFLWFSDFEIFQFRDFLIFGFSNFWTFWFWDFLILGFSYFGIFWFWDFLIFCIFKFREFKFLGYYDFRFFRIWDLLILGFYDLMILGFTDFLISEFSVFGFLGFNHSEIDLLTSTIIWNYSNHSGIRSYYINNRLKLFESFRNRLNHLNKSLEKFHFLTCLSVYDHII